jgi:hypothetical protein
MSNPSEVHTTPPAGPRKGPLSAKQADADRDRINELARCHLPALAKRLLPTGRVKGRYWLGHVSRQGQPLLNLGIDLVNGSWRDFHDGKRGHDIQGLISHVAKLEPLKAHLALKQMIGAE